MTTNAEKYIALCRKHHLDPFLPEGSKGDLVFCLPERERNALVHRLTHLVDDPIFCADMFPTHRPLRLKGVHDMIFMGMVDDVLDLWPAMTLDKTATRDILTECIEGSTWVAVADEDEEESAINDLECLAETLKPIIGEEIYIPKF